MQIYFRLLPTKSIKKLPEKPPEKLEVKKAQNAKDGKQVTIYLLAAIAFLALTSCFKALFNVSFMLMLVLMIILVLLLLNYMYYDSETITISESLPPKNSNSNTFFNHSGFKVYFIKPESQNFFAYKEIQNLVFSFKDVSSKHSPTPYMMSWEAISSKKKKPKQYQCFFDDTEKYVESDFVTLFQYFYGKNIPFSEVSEAGEKLRMLRLPAQEKPPKEQKIAAKYQKLIDEIGKKKRNNDHIL